LVSETAAPTAILAITDAVSAGKSGAIGSITISEVLRVIGVGAPMTAGVFPSPVEPVTISLLLPVAPAVATLTIASRIAAGVAVSSRISAAVIPTVWLVVT